MAKKRWTSALAGLAAVALLSAACGSDAESVTDAEELPINTEGGDEGPGTASACLADEPDCTDNPALPDTGQDLPPIDDEPEAPLVDADSSTGVLVEGGLLVGDALTTEATGVLAVKGHGFDDGDGVRLCESLAPAGERYECGGASVLVENLELDVIGADLVIHDGLTYTQDEIVLFGEVVEGVLVLRPTVTG